jgi:hypothetical protein
MSPRNIYRVAMISLFLTLYVTPSVGEDTPTWLTSAGYKLRLSAWDKFYTGPYDAKYLVKSDSGRTFVAEKHVAAGDNPATAEVTFPDDFHDTHNLQAGINYVGTSYSWEIYTNDVLRDSGSITFVSANVQKTLMRDEQKNTNRTK